MNPVRNVHLYWECTTTKIQILKEALTVVCAVLLWHLL